LVRLVALEVQQQVTVLPMVQPSVALVLRMADYLACCRAVLTSAYANAMTMQLEGPEMAVPESVRMEAQAD
jgi:hypothetical protein